MIAKIQSLGFQSGSNNVFGRTEKLDDIVVEKRFTIDDSEKQLIVSFTSSLHYDSSYSQLGAAMERRYAKNKHGEITAKIHDSVNELIDMAQRQSDYANYRVLRWNTIVLSIKNRWQMCDCWPAHEEHCKDSLPENSYHFVTFTNACYTIFTDVKQGALFTVHIEANNDVGHGAQNIEKIASEFRNDTATNRFQDKEPDNAQAVRLCVGDVDQFNQALCCALCTYAQK